MKKEEVNTISAQWVAQASKDVRDKIKSFAEACEIEPLAMHSYFDLTKDELAEVLNGEKTPSLELFSKIMVLTNNTIAIVPIKDVEDDAPTFDSPCEDRQRHDDDTYHNARHVSAPRRPYLPNFRQVPPPPPPHMFMRNIPVGDGHTMVRHPNPFDDAKSNEYDEYCEPFKKMTRARLIDIICKKHWDSEIDLMHSTFGDLVKFLGKKNEGIHKNKKIERAENGNPELMKFVDSLKQLTKSNPQVTELVKNIVNNL